MRVAVFKMAEREKLLKTQKSPVRSLLRFGTMSSKKKKAMLRKSRTLQGIDFSGIQMLNSKPTTVPVEKKTGLSQNSATNRGLLQNSSQFEGFESIQEDEKEHSISARLEEEAEEESSEQKL